MVQYNSVVSELAINTPACREEDYANVQVHSRPTFVENNTTYTHYSCTLSWQRLEM